LDELIKNIFQRYAVQRVAWMGGRHKVNSPL
jgi:hypothetical protein